MDDKFEHFPNDNKHDILLSGVHIDLPGGCETICRLIKGEGSQSDCLFERGCGDLDIPS